MSSMKPDGEAHDGGKFSLSDNDVSALVKVLGKAMEGDADQMERRRRVMRGLCELIDADAWAWSLVHMELGEAPRQVLFVYDGIPDEKLPPYLATLEHPDMKWMLEDFVHDAVEAAQPITRCDAQIWPDGWPNQSGNSNELWSRAGFRSYILTAWPLVDGGFSGVGIYRHRSRPLFGPRETRIAHIVLSGIPWLHQDGWGEERGAGLMHLAPREREILHLLVQGFPRKIIAEDLGISANTVSGYVKHIYRVFGVSSHAELIARFTCGDGGDLA